MKDTDVEQLKRIISGGGAACLFIGILVLIGIWIPVIIVATAITLLLLAALCSAALASLEESKEDQEDQKHQEDQEEEQNYEKRGLKTTNGKTSSPDTQPKAVKTSIPGTPLQVEVTASFPEDTPSPSQESGKNPEIYTYSHSPSLAGFVVECQGEYVGVISGVKLDNTAISTKHYCSKYKCSPQSVKYKEVPCPIGIGGPKSKAFEVTHN